MIYMGRYYTSKKNETDYFKSIDIYWLKKYGYLNGRKNGGIEWTRGGSGIKNSIGIEGNTIISEPYVRFFYTTTKNSGEKKEMNYKIPLTTTPCNFGGKRYWFICPLSVNNIYCGKRVGTLYSGGDYYGCRHCYNLTYNSRNLSGIFKVAGQIISEPKLEKLRQQVRTKYYAGKMTKRYKRYLEKQDKSMFQRFIVVKILNGKFK